MNHFNTSTHNELCLNKASRVECYLTKTKRAKTSGLVHFYALSLCFNVIIRVTAVCLSVFVKHFKLRQVRSLVRGCEICLCSTSVVSLAFRCKDRCVPSHTHRIIPYSPRKLLAREQQRLFCISACGNVMWFFGGLASSLTVVLRNPVETKSELTGSCGRDALQSPSPFGPDARRHTLAQAATQAGVRTVQRWEDDVTAPCRRTCSMDLDPFQAQTHRCIGTGIHNIYVHNPPLPPNKGAHTGKTLNIRLGVRRQQFFLLVCGAVSQWLAWIQAHSDRIWGLRLNMLPKRRTYPSPQQSQLL